MVKHTRRRHKRRHGGVEVVHTPESVACGNYERERNKSYVPSQVKEKLRLLCEDAKAKAAKTRKGGRRRKTVRR